ncbi:divisome protein SepX/GlpR [Jongsikchunia kroppenstedtii]|uniref:divisome protein SepX/GlpR n=1 Tax=Jongsikchunia kroppenstedtii TaxID=1121721 RepID=UPI000368C32D|nr:gephyrin-like molybdotransferase receptor GlpR [Jongsikchunia kroppenstedtii]
MPNSVLWICLVAIWLFVLVPMVVKARPELRKTTQATLAARVLHQGGRQVAGLRTKLAQGRHPHDAEWEPPAREYHKAINTSETLTDDEDDQDVKTATEKVTTKVASKPEKFEKDSPAINLDDDLEDDLNIDADDSDDETDVDKYFGKASDLDADTDTDDEDDLDDVAEDDDDVEVEDAVDEDVAETGSTRRGRGGYDPDADLRRSESRYRNRQRTLVSLATITAVAVVLGVMLGMIGWALTGIVGAMLLGYMFFLRRSVANEQRIRARRAARLARNRRDQETRRARPADDRRMQPQAQRRRPAGVVLEIDDEDPVFDHLPHYQFRARGQRPEDYRRVV